jgi:hypothetical protein
MFVRNLINEMFPLLFHPELGGIADITATGGEDDLDILQNNKDDDNDNKDDKDTKDEKDEKDEKDDKDDVDDDKDKDDKDDDEDEDDKDKDDEDEEDKDKEDEEEDEELDEELKLTSTVTDIKKEFPEFFKKFPDIRAALFRDQRYLETVGSVEDAEKIAKKADILDSIENDVLRQGNVIPFLDTLKKEGDEAFPKVMGQILPYLQKTDKDLYLDVVAVPIKQLLRAAFREGGGKKSDLGRAALYIHHYFFNGNTDVEAELKNERTPKEEKSDTEKRLEQRLTEIEEREYKGFKTGVDDSYISRMTKEIRSTLDKDERLDDYKKSKLVEDILTDLRDQMYSDERYLKSVNALWEQAKKSAWSNDFKSRIVSTALARAKSLLPESRKKLVAKALGKKVNKDNEDKDKNKDRSDNKKNDESRFHSRERNRDDRREKPKKLLTDLEIIRG